MRLACADPELLRQADALVARAYTHRGLQPPPLRPQAHRDGEMVFAACDSEGVIGTLTLGVDRADGLLADELYHEEINEVRRQGARVCEVTRFAVDSCAPSRDVIAAIFNVAFILARNLHHCTDAFIEVNPRHTGFYRRLLGYRIAGPLRTCPRVHAPAVLMHIRLDDVERRIAETRRNAEGDRSLYRLFMSPDEQARILNRWIRINAVEPDPVIHA